MTLTHNPDTSRPAIGVLTLTDLWGYLRGDFSTGWGNLWGKCMQGVISGNRFVLAKFTTWQFVRDEL